MSHNKQVIPLSNDVKIPDNSNFNVETSIENVVSISMHILQIMSMVYTQ